MLWQIQEEICKRMKFAKKLYYIQNLLAIINIRLTLLAYNFHFTAPPVTE